MTKREARLAILLISLVTIIALAAYVAHLSDCYGRGAEPLWGTWSCRMSDGTVR